MIFYSSFLSAQQSIRTIKLLPPGSVVTTTGIITTGPEFGQIRYMQDEEAGIAIYSPSLVDRVAGDSISITGVLSSFKGQVQLSPVLSHQLLASSVDLPPIVEIDLSDPELASFDAMRASLPCIGVSTCEPSFDEGWFTIFDDEGTTARMLLAESNSLIGEDIPADPVTATGIWTMQDDYFQLLCEFINDAEFMICRVIDAADIRFEDTGLATLAWRVIGNGNYHIEFGETNYDSIDFIFSNESEVQYTFLDSLVTGHIYKARLLESFNGQTAYSLPVFFSLPSPGPFRYQVFFNRSVDSSFSDGSHPDGVGSQVIQSAIISKIDEVQSTLDMAVYNTTSDLIIDAVKRAVQRGVQVRYVADDETSNTALQGILPFPVFYRSGDGLMHNKFIIGDAAMEDKAWVWTGSTNFSGNQLASDPNHAYIFRHMSIAQNYKREFDELWGADLNHNGARSGEMKTDNTCHKFLMGDSYIESYFSPSDETNCHIVEALRSADYHVEIGLLLLTKEDLVDELIELHQNGIEIRLIVEDEESSSVALARLQQAGIPTAAHDFPPIFHHKYAIIDEGFMDSDPLVITGSHNWTYSAENINDENTLIVHDQSFANIFRQEFEARWSELKNTSAQDIPDDRKIILYPNPAMDYIGLTNPENHNCTITLLNVNGFIVSTHELGPYETFQLKINKDITGGLYFMRWRWSDGYATSRIVIQN